MSAIIDAGKMRFSLFGRGYEDTREDSGPGEIVEMIKPPIKATTAIIDQTKQYVWTCNYSQAVYKWDISDIEDWQDTAQSIITNNGTRLIHPTNVPNNYGIYFSTTTSPAPGQIEGDVIIFDLTDNTVYYTIHSTDVNFIGFLCSTTEAECILVDNKLYLANKGYRFVFASIDLTDGTITSTYNDSECFYCFINDDTMLVSNRTTWWYDTLVQYGRKFDGTNIWTVQGTEEHPAYHLYVKNSAIGANNFMYLPTNKSGYWRVGKYKGWTAPTFDPIPMYSSAFGKLEQDLQSYELSSVAFEDGRERCAFMFGYSMCLTEDFKDLTQLVKSDLYYETYYPLALREDLLIAREYLNNVVVYIL